MHKKKILPIALKLQGDMINFAFTSLKETLPAITSYKKVKTNNNQLILGKWQTKR
tara:strand:+ start:3263 stop:3427 length:165 start_codon:yes stop_codon:yes gene_type:complete